MLPELDTNCSRSTSRARVGIPRSVLKFSPDEAAALCRKLAGDDMSRQLQFTFLMRKHGALAGQTVTTAIGQGRLARVLQLAQAWRHEPQQLGQTPLIVKNMSASR